MVVDRKVPANGADSDLKLCLGTRNTPSQRNAGTPPGFQFCHTNSGCVDRSAELCNPALFWPSKIFDGPGL